MESTGNGKTTTATSPQSDSVAAHDSAIFGDISDLSPVKPLKAASVVPGFTGYSSLPSVFTSPHLNTLSGPTYLERPQCPQSSSAESSKQRVRCEEIAVGSNELEKSKTHGSSELVPCIGKERHHKGSAEDQAATSSGCIDELFANDLEESLLYIQEYGDFSETTTEASNKIVENMNLRDPKDQQHCGMHRQSLCFEEAQLKTGSNNPGFWNPSTMSSSKIPAIPGDLKVSESSHEEVRESSTSKQQINWDQSEISTVSLGNIGNSRSTYPKQSGIGLHLNIGEASTGKQQFNWDQLVNSMVSPGNIGNARSTNPKQSGIGLHLNSFINPMPKGCGAIGSTTSAEIGYLKSLTLWNEREKVSASSEVGSHVTQSSVETNSLASQFVNHLDEHALLTQFEYQAPPCDKRKFTSGHDNAIKELSLSSPKQRRKKSSAINDGDGCKRCNCRKSRCLKLYCDCFAAGFYCAETCACEECLNRPDYEDTVLETRELIEARDPLAFAPKILQRIDASPPSRNEDVVNNSTPSSARHKRGCNCKKSMCLKKYCECYQANVGCSSGCRCEGCKNVYGRKEEYCMAKNVFSKGPGSPFDDKLEMVASQDGLLPTELCNPHDWTPLTPSFLFSDHGKDASKCQFITRRCLSSPESDLTLLPSSGNSRGLPGSSDDHGMLPKARKDVEDIYSFRQEYDNRNVEAVEDDMPDILKDIPTPINAMKVSSPNKKRVSPHHSSCSSTGLIRGRKFILRGLPSFPPLTPCIDSKDSSRQDLNDRQDFSTKKRDSEAPSEDVFEGVDPRR